MLRIGVCALLRVALLVLKVVELVLERRRNRSTRKPLSERRRGRWP